MSHPLTDIDSFPAAITVPDDGDDDTAGSVEVGFQALADRTGFLEKRMFGGAYVLALPTKAQQIDPTHASDEWTWDPVEFAWQTTAATAGAIYCPIQFPHLNATAGGKYPRLSIMNVRSKGNGHSATPANSLTASVYRKDSAGTVTLVGGQFDSATFPTIDAVHDWNGIDLNHELDPESTYWLKVTSESGADSTTGHILMRVAIDLLPPSA
jgi:hypothetical protein